MDAVELGADIKATDALKRNAVLVAAFHQQASAASLLIEAGGSIDAQDLNGMAPLHGAVVVGAIDVAGILITKGANINLADASGHTPLHIAAATGQTAMTELLLQNGANPKLRTVSGLTAATLAANNGHGTTAASIRTRPAAPVRAADQKVGAGATATGVPAAHRD
jgi:ankyrin repeat protein